MGGGLGKGGGSMSNLPGFQAPGAAPPKSMHGDKAFQQNPNAASLKGQAKNSHAGGGGAVGVTGRGRDPSGNAGGDSWLGGDGMPQVSAVMRKHGIDVSKLTSLDQVCQDISSFCVHSFCVGAILFKDCGFCCHQAAWDR